jgi:hypothetical protein
MPMAERWIRRCWRCASPRDLRSLASAAALPGLLPDRRQAGARGDDVGVELQMQ